MMQTKNLIWLLLLPVPVLTKAQSHPATTIINSHDVEAVERVLSADDMQGRKVNTPGIEKAAAYISSQFKSAGLQSLDPGGNFRQQFTMVNISQVNLAATLNGQPLDSEKVIVFTSGRELLVHDTAGYKTVVIRPGDNLFRSALRLLREEENALVLVDPSFSKNFSRLDAFRQIQFKSSKSLVFVLTDVPLSRFSLTYRQDVTEHRLANIVGVLPGKSRKNEYVIFSAHYDHLGIGEPDRNQDSIYNGANDDASGTTAVIMLAKYFSRKGNNQRTLIFAAFTAEEIGEYGSAYFSRQFNPARVSAMFNIEMIGTQSKWGKNSAYITGYEKTDMGSILKKNLAGSPFRFYPDPYPDQQLFYRSDNATLARLGVPAHTISTSKMDSEKYYHTPGDEIRTLDLDNMTQIIQAIAVSSSTIVSGKDTPSRVDAGSLR